MLRDMIKEIRFALQNLTRSDETIAKLERGLEATRKTIQDLQSRVDEDDESESVDE